MQVWFNGRLFENREQDADLYEDTPPELPSDGVDKLGTVAVKKTDPTVVVKRINLRDKLYANIINFIQYNVGNIEELDSIKEYQGRIHDLFDLLADEVASEYNAQKGKSKENLKVRDDSTKRKVSTIYRFFAYYIIKYDKNSEQADKVPEKIDINRVYVTYSEDVAKKLNEAGVIRVLLVK